MLSLVSRPLPQRPPSRSVVCRASLGESDRAGVSRREAISTAAAAASVVFAPTTAARPALTAAPTSSPPSPSRAARGRTLVVDPRGGFPPGENGGTVSFFRTVEEAVAEAREGDVVALSSEVEEHPGRAVLSVPGVTLTTLGYDSDESEEESEESDRSPSAERVAASAGPPRERKRATLRHETPKPYESTIEISAPRCRVIGVDVRHSSKSVANNYAVFVREEAAAGSEGLASSIAECDVSSDTGAAVGVEAPSVISRCSLRSKSRFGAAVFAATTISRSEVSGGGGKGSGSLLARNADVVADRSVFRRGDLVLADGSGEFRRCVLEGARVERGPSWEARVEEFL